MNNLSEDMYSREMDPEISGGIPYTETDSPWRADIKCEPIDSLPLAILSGVVATITIAANLLVIVAILRGSSHFQRPIYWLIIHLSFADLLVGIMLLWNYCVASLLDIHNTFTSLLVIFCLWVACEASSTLGFVMLAIDRYVQIFHKHFHRTYATRVTVGMCIAMAWCFSLTLLCLAPILGWSCTKCECQPQHYMQCNPMAECSQVVPPLKKSYTLTMAGLLFVCIPIPVFIYCTIFFKVRRTAPLVRQSRRRHDMRLIKTLSVILIVFIITLCPVAILMVFDYLHTARDENMIAIAFYIFVLAFLNSLANPLLYIWRMSPIRKSIRKVLCFSKPANVSRRDMTSYQSDGRSPTIGRQKTENAEELKFLALQNNNKPRPTVLCLHHMKKGKYSPSRTSTPLSMRACDDRDAGLRSSGELESDPLQPRDVELQNGQVLGNTGDPVSNFSESNDVTQL